MLSLTFSLFSLNLNGDWGLTMVRRSRAQSPEQDRKESRVAHSVKHAVIRSLFGFLFTILALSGVGYATLAICDHCECSGSALSDNWHYSKCNWGGDCNLHPGTRCSNIG